MEWSPYHWTLGGADSLCFKGRGIMPGGLLSFCWRDGTHSIKKNRHDELWNYSVCVCVTWQRWLKHWPLFLNCINREANIYLYISRGSMINWTCTTSWIRSTTQHSLDSYSWSSLNGFHILGFCMEHHFILNDCKPFSFYLSPWVLSMAWTMSSH